MQGNYTGPDTSGQTAYEFAAAGWQTIGWHRTATMARGKPMAWDVTVPDNYAESHISHTARKAGAAANKAFGERDSQIRSSVCLT